VSPQIADLRIDANEEFVEKTVFLSVANQWFSGNPFFSGKSGHFPGKTRPFSNYGFLLVSRFGFSR